MTWNVYRMAETGEVIIKDSAEHIERKFSFIRRATESEVGNEVARRKGLSDRVKPKPAFGESLGEIET